MRLMRNPGGLFIRVVVVAEEEEPSDVGHLRDPEVIRGRES